MKLYEKIMCVIGSVLLIVWIVSVFTGMDAVTDFIYCYWWLVLTAIIIITCCILYDGFAKKNGNTLTKKDRLILALIGSVIFSIIAASTLEYNIVRYYCQIPLIAGLGALMGLQLCQLWAFIYLALDALLGFVGIDLPQPTIGNEKKVMALEFKWFAIITAIIAVIAYLILPHTNIVLPLIPPIE